MRALGELILLSVFVSSGFAAFACTMGWQQRQRRVWIAGAGAALWSVLALTALTCILAWALLAKDYRFAYVAAYSSGQLPWHYSVSALWVGQAGSLLLWAWFSAILSVVYGGRRGWQPDDLRMPALGVLMAYLCFLVAIMVFAADPMEASVATVQDGVGLSPLLQHPAMLIHPPIVFLGYALWTVPFALALVALISGRLDTQWLRAARPWALAAWAVLGGGILLGAVWAYQELGWGGYWGWDPVENGSLIPWLTGTALIHVMMSWQHVGVFKRTTLALAIATFGLCNFATFLTRSGIFSSLHAFSASPIGWLFLVLMLALVGGGALLLVFRNRELQADRPIRSVLSREAFVLVSAVALLLLMAVTLGGTVSAALTNVILGRPIMMGPSFYNYVLIPTGLLLLTTTAMAPLLRWGGPPSDFNRRWLRRSVAAGALATAAAWLCGVRHPIAAVVVGLAIMALVALLSSSLADAWRRSPRQPWWGLWRAWQGSRRQYAGFLIHLGFVCLALGVTGSSLGTRQQDMEMKVGDAATWAGYDIRLAAIHQRQLPSKLIGEAELKVSRGTSSITTLRPAQHFHRLQREWTTEVAIHSTWRGDLYVILHSGDGQDKIRLTFVDNPMMRWLWLGGWIMVSGTVLRLWPTRQRFQAESRFVAERPAPQARHDKPGSRAA